MTGYAGNDEWRKSWPELEVSDEGLSPFKGRFPSLEISDFCNWLESRGTDVDVVSFVRDLGKELVFAYSMWAKVARDSNAALLLGDMLNNAFENGPVKAFLTDYAKANNLTAVLPKEEKPKPWQVVNGEMLPVKGNESIA